MTAEGALALIDAENVFYSVRGRAAEALFALQGWCNRTLQHPRRDRIYGKRDDPAVANLEEQARLSGAVVVHVGFGKDKADEALLADLAKLQAGEYLVASGDIGLLTAAAKARSLDWVILSPGTRAAYVTALLPGLEPERLVPFRRIFADRVNDAQRRRWPARNIDGEPMPQWADLLTDVVVTNDRWQERAEATLRARGHDEEAAKQLAGALSRWLPVALPPEHHGRDFTTEEGREHWRWACMAAVAAAAIEPGTSNLHRATSLFISYERDGSETWDLAKARARKVVTDLVGGLGDREHYLVRRARKLR